MKKCNQETGCRIFNIYNKVLDIHMKYEHIHRFTHVTINQ